MIHIADRMVTAGGALRPQGTCFIRSSDGTPIFVRATERRGPLGVLLIHGYLFSSELFARQFEGEFTERCQVVAMDIRGHGRQGKPDHASAYLDAELWANDVACVVRALDLERFAIVGWSMGSRVALNYGQYRGFERVVGLNLVSAVVSGPRRGTQAPLTEHLADLLADDPGKRERCTETFVRACAGDSRLPPIKWQPS